VLKWVVGFNGFILCYLCGALKVGKSRGKTFLVFGICDFGIKC